MVKAWVQSQIGLVRDNPFAVRDSRLQLRGSKTAILLTVIFAVVTLAVGALMSAMLRSRESYWEAQAGMAGIYQLCIYIVGGVITLVAPCLGVFSIVTERQRRTLDILFSTPVAPHQYLVGKLLASYRFIWLVLSLSLPFLAVPMSFGGFHLSTLLIHYFVISVHGLTCASLGLLVSALNRRLMPALLMMLVVIGGVVAAMVWLGSEFSMQMGAFDESRLRLLLAFQVWSEWGSKASFGLPVWILYVLIQACIIRLLLIAAASLLAPGTSSPEIRKLRINAPIAAFCVTLFVFLDDWRVPVRGPMYGTMMLLLGLLMVPYLAAYGHYGLKRQRFDGAWSLRNTLMGKTSGQLPFIALIFAISAGTAGLFGEWERGGLWLTLTAMAGGLWLLSFAAGWLASAAGASITHARWIAALTYLGVAALPLLIAVTLAPAEAAKTTGLWNLVLVSPVFAEPPLSPVNFIHAGGLLVLGLAALGVAITQSNLKAAAKMNQAPHSGA